MSIYNNDFLQLYSQLIRAKIKLNAAKNKFNIVNVNLKDFCSLFCSVHFS